MRIVEKREWADDRDVFWRLLELLHKKSKTLLQGRWPECTRKILVIQLVDYPLAELLGTMDTDAPNEDGFSEIWLADYSIRDMYGGVDLFPITHPDLEGPFLVASTDKKPWG